MPEPFIGEIKLVPYTFAPRGWATCAGQLLPIAQNTALFSLLGTTYGGNGQTTFALPDLRERTVLSFGTGPGLTPRGLGEEPGQAAVTLTVGQLPAHSHTLNVSGSAATTPNPIGALPAVAPVAVGAVYSGGVSVGMPNAVGATGGNQPHENRQPFLTLHYIIALEGIFPSRN